ncbi:MAG: hypothetical protein ABSF09_10510 [Candidatus Bathyarchaeia archaeon]
MRTLLESGIENRMDASKIKELALGLQNELRKFSTIKAQCSTIEKSAKAIKNVSDELKEDIDERLADILRNITENSY